MARIDVTSSNMRVEFAVKPNLSQVVTPEKIKEVIKEVVKVETVTIIQEVTASVTLEHAAPDGSPFPEAWPGPAPDGVVSGGNGLVRNRYTNGQALTAELLRREQRYHDARARVVAQAFPAGVAWGLGLRVQGRPASHGAVLSNGTAVELDSDAVLEAGLAFDGAGRPIAVGGDFAFTFRRLLAAASARPVEVVRPESGFQPCVCLRPSPTSAVGGGERAGLWLLVISPEERPHGEAKLYGVRGAAPIGCVADGWRGGFGLSLARLPLELSSLGATDVWSLRGALVAWLFDTWERDLGDRWAGGTPAREPNEGAPPLASAVPLALIAVASDGSVLFCDRWAPRRPLVESAPSASGRAALGAETLSRAVARRFQFQSMLVESLSVLPMDFGGAPSRAQDLYSRGFRHLPPAGVLPVALATSPGQDALGHARAILGAAAAWFQGTNVIIGEEIALTEDLLHAEIEDASALDPIRLAPASAPTAGTSLEPWVQQPALRRFGEAILARKITLEQLARGEVVLVRLIASLHAGATGVEARPLVAFARSPLSLSLDLPPPPPPPTLPGDGAALAVAIDSPAAGQILWVGDRVSFRWATTGGVGAVTHTATLTGATRRATSADQSLPATQSFSLIQGSDGQSGALVIPDASLAGPTTLTVQAMDSAGQATATRDYVVRKRSAAFAWPHDGYPIANDSGVLLRWEIAEGWTITAIDLTASFDGILVDRSIHDPLTGEVHLGGDPVQRSLDVARGLAGATRELEISLTALLGADNHLVGRLTISLLAQDAEGRSASTAVGLQLSEPGAFDPFATATRSSAIHTGVVWRTR